MKLAGGLILLALVLGGGAYAYSAYQQRAARIALEQQQQEEARIAEEARKAEQRAAREAEERGFASVDEMRTLRWRGFKTKAEYVEAQQREQAEARERQLAEERSRAPPLYLAAQTSEIVKEVEYKCINDPEVHKIEFVVEVLEDYARKAAERSCRFIDPHGQAYDVRVYFRPR